MYYRLYFHDRHGHFLRHEEVEADTDEAALERAREIDHAYCIEVWQRSRQVGIVAPSR